ncbi:hypothetical protein ACSJE7_004700 [Escherichia coli]
MSKSPRHKLNKTDKRLLDTLVAAGYEHDKVDWPPESPDNQYHLNK